MEKTLKAGNYLKKEMEKLAKNKEKIRNKIRNEKEILNLKEKINVVKNRKK